MAGFSQVAGTDFQRVVFACQQLLDAAGVDVESQDCAMSPELNGKRKSNISEADDGDFVSLSCHDEWVGLALVRMPEKASIIVARSDHVEGRRTLSRLGRSIGLGEIWPQSIDSGLVWNLHVSLLERYPGM
ncbi:hypothetical protein D3C72_1838940 [compost metagenome]